MGENTKFPDESVGVGSADTDADAVHALFTSLMVTVSLVDSPVPEIWEENNHMRARKAAIKKGSVTVKLNAVESATNVGRKLVTVTETHKVASHTNQHHQKKHEDINTHQQSQTTVLQLAKTSALSAMHSSRCTHSMSHQLTRSCHSMPHSVTYSLHSP